MQKNWLRVFLLCVACAVCLHGNCSAERWVQYFISFGDKIFMDIDSIKAWEYKGRKYLGAYVKGNLVASISKELYVLVDLENERKLELNKSCILNGQIDDRYFDILINTPKNKKIVSPQEYVVLSHGNLPVEKAFMQCAEQNRPDVIQEIRQHNQQYAAQHPQSNVPTGTVADGAKDVTPNGIGENLPPNTLEEQPLLEIGEEVKIPIRIHPEWTYSAWKNPFDDVAYEYGVGRYYINEDGRRRACPDLYLFDYDPETKFFTFSGPALRDLVGGKYMYRVRVINHNTVEIEWLNGDEEPTISTNCPYPHEIYTYRELTPAEKNLIIREYGEGSATSPTFVSEHGVQYTRYYYKDGSAATVAEGFILDWGVTDIIAIETAITLSELGYMPGYPESGSPAYGFHNSNIDITSWPSNDDRAVSFEVLKY